MKTLIVTLFAIGSILGAGAQTSETECLRKISLVDSLVNAGNYPAAMAPWAVARKDCPWSGNSLYTVGETLLKRQVEMAAANDKETAVRDLLDLYDQQSKYFPTNAKANALKKAMALHSVNKGSEEEIFKLLDNAFVTNPDSFTDAIGLYTYFELYFNKYKGGDKTISVTDLLAKQDAIESKLAMLSKTDLKHGRRAARTVSKRMDGLMVGVATCDNLVPYYESTFESKRTDTLWLERASVRLLQNQCMATPTFNKITQAANTLQPSKTAAFNLGSAALRSGNREQAAVYYQQAAALSETGTEKASTYYTLATTVYGNGDKAKAKEFAQKAIAANPKMGKAYMYLAQLYANAGKECGQTLFEQKAMYWLAADMVRKAGEADPNLRKNGSDQTAENYLKLAPTPDEIKAEKLGGKQINFKCWINESVTVPKP
ncbi:MAG TPA: hypothetical protein VF676_11645 [Flavobacterium sp.]|jgi:tetratricopeptide (TPR) repeat protein